MFSLFLQDAWKVLIASLVLGAGLPIVYAVGVRSLALGSTGPDDSSFEPRPVGKALAALCFLIVLAGVALGLTYVVASGQGKVLSFTHIYPTLVPKS